MAEDNSSMIWCVQVYDTQEHSLQVQAYRTKEGAITCVSTVKQQLDEQGGYEYSRPEGSTMAFDAESTEGERRVSCDVYEVCLND